MCWLQTKRNAGDRAWYTLSKHYPYFAWLRPTIQNFEFLCVFSKSLKSLVFVILCFSTDFHEEIVPISAECCIVSFVSLLRDWVWKFPFWGDLLLFFVQFQSVRVKLSFAPFLCSFNQYGHVLHFVVVQFSLYNWVLPLFLCSFNLYIIIYNQALPVFCAVSICITEYYLFLCVYSFSLYNRVYLFFVQFQSV